MQKALPRKKVVERVWFSKDVKEDILRNILVDEIDSYVHPADRHVVYSFLKDISKEVDVIAATHDIQLTSYGDKYYTVTSDMFVVDLQEITEEEYRNIV